MMTPSPPQQLPAQIAASPPATVDSGASAAGMHALKDRSVPATPHLACLVRHGRAHADLQRIHRSVAIPRPEGQRPEQDGVRVQVDHA